MKKSIPYGVAKPQADFQNYSGATVAPFVVQSETLCV